MSHIQPNFGLATLLFLDSAVQMGTSEFSG